jgi:hypothetical protein
MQKPSPYLITLYLERETTKNSRGLLRRSVYRERSYASETGEKKYEYLLPVATVLSYFPVREFVSSKLPQAADTQNDTRTDKPCML